MPIREPRLELDRQEINGLLNWSGVALSSICKFVRDITEASCVKINEVYVYNRGHVLVEDTSRRKRDCWMISIWDKPIDTGDASCLFQQPVPVKIRFDD